ncbi:MAG: phosphoadenosine phosphosulfate reductase family protein [Leadbetterella sp.]|nr:phosphoadenosine phosphosulfate reductase family protein [Leadbetterella sp.]
MFCSKCLTPVTKKDLKTLELIRAEYLKDNTPWYIGYSGGKDSSALLTLVINSLYNLKHFPRPVTVIYCDTGVENPIITEYVYKTFKSLKKECNELSIPINFKIVKPDIKDRFFVKVIGKGYPTPTNIFRWCTKSLRINPVKKIIDSTQNAIVLLGVRAGESVERDRTISKHKHANNYYLKQGTSTSKIIFAPILNYSIKDVWASIKFNPIPYSIDHDIIGKLYKDAGSECPVYKESKGTPCGKGRFGCWTCTVVRKDKSVESMIENGYESLIPLSNFRNWLAEFRDNKLYRCNYRRNGQKGLGPITLKGRKIILKKLLLLQEETGLEILIKEELDLIKRHWDTDIENPKYVENLYGS